MNGQGSWLKKVFDALEGYKDRLGCPDPPPPSGRYGKSGRDGDRKTYMRMEGTVGAAGG